MLDSLEKQRFKDFEYIIVDGLYDKRKTEVEKILKDYSFPITYVKDKPWFHSEEEQVGKRPGLSSARNTGVIHARGELMAWHDDNTYLPPDWLSRHVKLFEAGFDGVAGLSHGTYNSLGLEQYRGLYLVNGKPTSDKRCIPCQVEGKDCDHVEKTGELTLIKDYRKDYVGNPLTVGDEIYNVLPVGWLYGCNMSIRTEYVLKINGFPEEFCGQMGSEDSFTTVCLQRAGAKLLLDRKSFVIHISDEQHLGLNDLFNFKNNELMLMDGKMHFSNEKYVENLLFRERKRFQNNPHLNLRELRDEKVEVNTQK
jgi:glycosyltransferase involved in cell wall biosynthesis